ncbi:MAG: DUF3775 domain-containing protein [Woeseiaceae bacterium]|nr:DUF3775 domain-containing protein [Woeseiaceae bacterium]
MNRMEVELNQETIQHLIGMAQEFHTGEDITFDEEPVVAGGGWSEQAPVSDGGDPYYRELRHAIDDIEPDQQVTLLALMRVGRGDFSADEWDEALAQAEESGTEHAADDLIGTELLAVYLDEGLAQLDLAAEEDTQAAA